MDNIIHRLTEYENDIKLLKTAILVLEQNFKKIKSDIIDNCNHSNNVKKEIKKKPKKKQEKKEKKKKEEKKETTIFKKNSVILSDNNNIKVFFNINSSSVISNNKILVSELNKKINEYLLENKLIKDKKVYLNKELKTLLKTKKRIIGLDEILNHIMKLND